MPSDMAETSRKNASAGSPMRKLFAYGDKRYFSAIVGLVLAMLVLPPLLFLVKGAVTVT